MDPRICGMRAAPTAALDGFRHAFKLHSYSDLTELDFKWAPPGLLDLPTVVLRCGRYVAGHATIIILLCFRLLVLWMNAGSLFFYCLGIAS